jgi:hypothetical protein
MKSYCELGVEDPEENFVAALPKVLPNPICRKKTLPCPIFMKGAIIAKVKDGYGGRTSNP